MTSLEAIMIVLTYMFLIAVLILFVGGFLALIYTIVTNLFKKGGRDV